MSNPLVEQIKQMIETEGRISFAQFMEMALYHPEFGYYNMAEPKIGTDGDFYTSPDVHPLMGKVMAKQMRELWELVGSGDFSIVEIGAGKGVMALDILAEIKEDCPQFYNHISYIIIEKSRTFRAKQRELLVRYSPKVLWVDSLAYLKDAGGFIGCVLSNELLDSFPFHRVTQDGEGLKELYVTLADERFTEEAGTPSTNELPRYFNRLKIHLPDGIRTEVNLEMIKWVKEVAAALNKGFILTIDYGLPADLYYAPFRDRGTSLCYYRHTTNETPFERIGEQDITAHVDFTTLALEGMECGLEVLAFADLSHFLIHCGKDMLETEIRRAQNDNQMKSFKTCSAIKNLIHPEGIGGTFKVLLQGKGVEKTYFADMPYNKKHLLNK